MDEDRTETMDSTVDDQGTEPDTLTDEGWTEEADTPVDDQGTPVRPVFTLAQAAQVCGVSTKTLQRRGSELLAHGATRSDAGWVIPVEALLAVGLQPGRPTPGEQPQTAEVVEEDTVTVPRAEWERLRRELAVVSAQATERERTIELLELSMRQLGPAPARTEASELPTTEVIPTVTPEAPKRRSWFGRRAG